ncbi:MAG: hypothetical protein QXO27_03775, partial [Candidatus Aenigmatarchaeota archaeon]
EFSVGVSPPIIDLGEIGRDSTKIVKFHIVTPSTDPLLVYLEPERGSIDFFRSENYKEIILNYSEEDVSSWAEFLSNPIELKPVNETLKTKAGEIKGWKEISFLLNIPKDAEPGYHMLKIKPFPSVPSEIIGEAGARVVAITSVTVLFNVSGDARREGIILDVTSGNYIGNRLEINTYFQNVGTTTISARTFQNVYNHGESIANLTSQLEFIKPGEVKVFKTFLPTDKISSNDYDVFTTVDYTTNSTSKISILTIPTPSSLAITPSVVFPLWLIILIVIVVITICIYKWYKWKLK